MEIATRGGLTAVRHEAPVVSTHPLPGEQITRIEIIGSAVVLAGLILSVSAGSCRDLSRQIWARY